MKGSVLQGITFGRCSPAVDLLEAERERPDAPLLRWSDGAWSVRQFAQTARRCATRLAQLGIRSGDRVAILSTNCPYQLAWQYGAYLLGAVEVPINAELRGPMLAHVLEDADPSLLIVRAPLRAALDGLTIDLPPRHDLDGPEALAVIAAAEPISPPTELQPGLLAAILYTSGTTGPSKGVMLPHGAFSNLAQVIGAVLDLTPDDLGYFVMPFFHVDFHIVLPACIQRGAAIAFRERFSASRFWEDVRRYHVTWWFAIGALLSAVMTRELPADQAELPLRRIIGAPIPDDAYEFFEDRLGIPIQSMYGQTEGDGPLFETIDQRRRGSAGRPVAGFDVAIVDESDREVPPGTIGELTFRPQHPHLMSTGYWRRPDATAEASRDGWWHTGDLATMADDGFFFYRGRMTDSLRRRGENISAYELEATLRMAGGVRDAAAIAVRDDLGGEDDIKVFLLLDGPTDDFDMRDFFAFCEQNLPRFAVPRYVELATDATFVRSVGTGVVQKHLLPRSLNVQTIDRLAPQRGSTRAFDA